MNIIEALDDTNLLGASIRDPDSWKPWRALLAAAFGLALDPYQAELFRQCTGRAAPPGAPASYLWLIIGRRGGKSFCMALAAVYLAVFRDWRKYLSPGERAIVLLVAADREQAKILHRYCQGILSAPILQSLVWNVTASEIELKGGVTIEVVTRSYRTVRGRSVCVVGFIVRVAAFQTRLRASSLPNQRLKASHKTPRRAYGLEPAITIASPPNVAMLARIAFRTSASGLAESSSRQKASSSSTAVSQDFIDKEFERDPASAAAEYFAQFRSDVAEFVSIEVLEACTADGLFEIPPLPDVRYVAFVDPSGGSSDSFSMGIAHREPDGLITLDCIRETRAPFAPEAVVEDFCKTLASYRVGRVHGDRYAGEWPREQFKKRNVDYAPSERVKSDIYNNMLPLLNSRRVQLLDNRRLIGQLHGLERRTARGGKDSIDHGPGQHDDVANAVAGAIVLASAYVRRLNFHVPIVGPSRSAVIGAYETAMMGAVSPIATAEDAAYAASRGQH